MSRKSSLFYSIFGITALIAILAVFSVRVFFERQENLEKNNLFFSELQNVVVSSYLARGSFSDPYFSSSLRGFIEKHPDYLSVVAYNAAGPLYIYSVDSKIIAFSTKDHILNWNGAPTFTIRPFFEEVTSSKVSIPGNESVYVSTVYTILSVQNLFLYIRDSIIAIAALLVLTVVFIAIFPFIKEKNSSAETIPIVSSPPEKASPAVEPLVVPQENEQGPLLSKEAGDAQNNKITGLFSPETGLGWEQYIDSRLSFELRRAASYDQDLVLVLFRSSELSLLE